ncbi:MAG TPA: LLM class flavin-dependent oxidoreductase, partial [Dehalococcoidia bacterium]|nr:LLM class flavin-dependent oxidoreductase [Dehalococcoidia bacterium]
SIGAVTKTGIQALPSQWGFAEESALKNGNVVHRKHWRIVMSWHIAETREQARREAGEGSLRHNNEYTVGTLRGGDGPIYKTPDEAVDDTAFSEGSTSVIGTPDDLITRIEQLLEITGGFGCVVGFVHDWVNRKTLAKAGLWLLVT